MIACIATMLGTTYTSAMAVATEYPTGSKVSSERLNNDARQGPHRRWTLVSRDGPHPAAGFGSIKGASTSQARFSERPAVSERRKDCAEY